MKKLEFKISINASKEKVWYSLWDNDNYETWTSAFCEGTYAISDWEEGSKIHFLSPSGEGMTSIISTKKEFESMIFTHISEIKEYVEMPIDEKIKSWTGCTESYFLEENSNKTMLKVIVEALPEYENFFNTTFNKALENVKTIAENPITKSITVRASVNVSLEKAWNYFTLPEHIINWNFAHEDWHCPKAENELELGKQFRFTMASKDGTNSFVFIGNYKEIIPLKKIAYAIEGDERKVTVKFDFLDQKTIITEIFEPETVHAVDLQRAGWQAILNNFKKYAEYYSNQ